MARDDPGLAPPAEPLFAALTDEDDRHEQLRRARLLAAAATLLAVALAIGWFWDRQEPGVNPKVRTEVEQALEAWRQVQSRAAAGRTITDGELLAAGVQPDAAGVRESLEIARDAHEAPRR